MGALFGGLFSVLGSVATGFFGLKQAQGDAIKEALKVVGEANSSSGQREAAIATIIAAENSSGSWLSSSWRPLVMMISLAMVLSFWFGYVPKGMMMEHVPPMVDRLLNWIELGLGGYMGARTFEKIVSTMNVGKVLSAYIQKKLA